MKTSIDKTAVADLQVDNVLRNVINGNSFDLNYLETAVPTNTAISLLIQTGNNVKMHFKVTLQSEGKAIFNSYINGTYSGGTTPDGVKLTTLKRNATVDYTSGVTVKYNPTITTLGTLRGNFLILGGVGPQSTGGATGTSESIIGPDSEFLIQLKNVSGQNKDMCVIIEWYEELI